MRDDQYLVTGSGDAELRVWKLSQKDFDLENKNVVERLAMALEFNNLDDGDDQMVNWRSIFILIRLLPRRFSSILSSTKRQVRFYGTGGEGFSRCVQMKRVKFSRVTGQICKLRYFISVPTRRHEQD